MAFLRMNAVDKNIFNAQLINMKINFSKILRDVMEQNTLNQLQMAEMLGVRQSQVSNWLNGKSLPGYYSIRMICTKLNVSADYLLELKDE